MQPRYFSAPLALKADPQDAQADSPPKRFAGVAYSGGPVQSWEGTTVIDLATTVVEARLPLMFQHDPESYIGEVHLAANNGMTLEVSGELFHDIDDRAREIVAKSGRGARYQMSVGLFDATSKTRKGPVTLNGRTIPGPVTILQGGIIREVSIVTLGADRSTSADFFSAQTGKPNMSHESDESGQIADLKAQLAAMAVRAETAEAALDAERKQAREVALSALFSELGRQCPEAAKPHYLAMSAEAFAAVAAELRASKPTAPAHLFQEQATGEPGGATPKPVIDMAAIYAARRVAK